MYVSRREIFYPEHVLNYLTRTMKDRIVSRSLGYVGARALTLKFRKPFSASEKGE